jgi:hypothetical protein
MGMMAIFFPRMRQISGQRSSKTEPDQPASLACHIFASAAVRVRKISRLYQRVIGREQTHMSAKEHR